MLRAEVKIGAPQKIFLDPQICFQTFGQKLRPRPLKWRPPFCPFLGGGGVQPVVFWSNLRPYYYIITGRGPAGPPLATALRIFICLTELQPNITSKSN
jgi:hypothetical protein